VLNYVLGRPQEADARLMQAAADDAAAAVEILFRDGWDRAVQWLHSRETGDGRRKTEDGGPE
jgi:peptidyl-tRNA hydrolase